MRYQPIYDIAEVCVRKNIRQVVLCPGSRSAPLALAFIRHPGIQAKIFSDERSAGFIALGMAQQSRRSVIVVCTSGTAVYNLAPAIAEAYFSQTPLVILTADRPAEWIAQLDGQTIFQTEIFGKHVKKYFQLPQDYEEADSVWAINRTVNEALNLASQLPCGPVHINAPFREPLYPSPADGAITYSKDVRIIEEHPSIPGLSDETKEKLSREWRNVHRILVVGGQQDTEPATIAALSRLQKKSGVAVAADIISNLHEANGVIRHADLFMGQAPQGRKEALQPDLLITFGQSLISKNLKIFLRKYPARHHWHIQEAGPVADTFTNLTAILRTSPDTVLDFLSSLDAPDQRQRDYRARWQAEEERAGKVLDDFLGARTGGELRIVGSLLANLPANANLHLANSMSVRYANFFGLSAGKTGVRVFSNRGTSGIDGCTSTAVGHSLVSARQNFLITGDLAFFYDRNAFWHHYPVQNLRILLLNNHGGLIFDILEGPSSLPEAREYFITRQMLNAKKLCEEFGFQYLRAEGGGQLEDSVGKFVGEGKSEVSVLELETDTATSKNVFEELKMKIKKSYES
ncbi:MAG TPA: 2-succinyl-5-enolpyruvyl-6-hydroxy-3-cyclohexene-1-carboxylic-acid synthase [Chryseosolibacter sp.]